MITKSNLKNMLKSAGFSDTSKDKYEKNYPSSDCSIIVDFRNEKIIYPEDKGFKVNVATTTNFSEPENFVVLECVNRLLDKGYRPENIELERTWTLGHEQKSGRADICVSNQNGKMLFIVECKTFGVEYNKEMKNILSDGGQLISYWQQERGCRWLVLYASNINSSNDIEYITDSIDCSDDENILNLARKDATILLYKDAHTASELYDAWKETYEQRFSGDIIFRDDSVAYDIGVKPLRKKDLKDFSENDKIVNRFEEILRHNNVSDKENAFNRLIALFICKLVDEIQKTDNDIVEFQYKVGTDTYESLQDRLQRLHKEGMEKFMREEVFYVSDDYAENLVKQYTKQKRVKMIEELRNTLRILKFYTNNDFAFKDVHNEELFYQNGKILVEMVQLFQNYRIIGSADVQMLGDLFEQLLNKGFKQNEGQFFTPTPITRFIWDSLPLEKIMTKADGIEYPKVIDYACGAGHFLTEGFEAVEVCANAINNSENSSNQWVEKKIFGIEKDYRLARVSKISMFMHGAGDGNIIFGDGLENYPDKEITPKSFDILVANPPYSVKAFKPHLKLSNNQLDILEKISNDLKKIGVKKDIYNKLLSKSEDYTHWKDDNYFGQHYDEFVTSTEYVKKSKQKTFLKLSDAEQKKWFNQKFYEYVFSIEEEKLFYYSLVYNQDTLIISAPDENKEQEKFLGYKWSNRKGQEGIQIIKAGGCLYNASDRSDNNSIAGLIRNAFSDEDEFDVEDLSDYYYRLRLQDMLDFSGTTFNKSIKSTPTRVLKDIPGLTNYRLSDKNFFDLSIGNRVLSDEVVENGSIPIYSANVFEEFGRIDKQNITDFSVPSILWGIDGDWMVNIMPADKPFYPTDHCGVLRIKTEDILPKYMALALQVEGEFERFSRSNRASTQRIANLIIQVPSVSEQQKIVDEIEAIDKRIADEQAIISEQSAKVKFKFVEMFGDNPATTHGKNSVKLSTLCENLDNERKPITEHLRNKGDIPYYGASGIVDYVAEYIFDETLLLISEDGANLVSRNMPIAFSITGKSWVNNHVHILRFKNYKLQKYVESYINNIDLSEYINKNANPKLTQEKLNSIMIYMPNDTTLDLYISSIDQCDKLKFEAQERLEELNAAREDIIDKYFR